MYFTKKANQFPAGNRITIRSTSEQHNRGSQAIHIYYCHLNEIADGIEIGSQVKQGQIIGKTGNTGNAADIQRWRDHVHIIVYDGTYSSNYKVDPRDFFYTKFDIDGNTIE